MTRKDEQLAPRITLAFAAGLALYLAVSGGALSIEPITQTALLVGGLVGLIAGTYAEAAICAIGALSLGMFMFPGYQIADSAYSSAWALQTLLLAVGGALVAVLVRFAIDSEGDQARMWVTRGLLVLVIVSGFWTAYSLWTAPQAGGGSAYDSFDLPVVPQTMTSDNEFYLRVQQLMRAGTPYYQAYRQAYAEHPAWPEDAPPSVLGYRLPTLYWAWLLLPSASWIIWAIILASAVATGAAYVLGQYRAGPEVAIVGAAAVSSLYLWSATTLSLVFVEPWAGLFVLLAVVVHGESDSPDWRRRLIGAVALVVLATLIRELAAVALIAGIVYAIFGDPEQRAYRLTGWAVGLAIVIVGYIAHIYAIAGAVAPRAASTLLRGGWQFFVAGLTEGKYFFGDQAWLQALLVIAGVVGLFAVKDRAGRAALAMLTAVPLLSLLVFGNGTFVPGGVSQANYWSTVVLPTALAMLPWAFALVPQWRPLMLPQEAAQAPARGRSQKTGGKPATTTKGSGKKKR